MEKKAFEEKSFRIFEKFHEQWALATAGNSEGFNTCTIGWGSLGTLWRLPVATIYVNPSRYTWQFLENSDYFTVSFFPQEYRKDLELLGTKSGRDGDKIAETGLTPEFLENGVTFREAELTFVCRKLYDAPFERKYMSEQIDKGLYKNWEPHYMYVGEIIDVIEK